MTIDIEKLIAEVDGDKSGMIEYEEFMDLLSFQHWVRNLSKKQLHYYHKNYSDSKKN